MPCEPAAARRRSALAAEPEALLEWPVPDAAEATQPCDMIVMVKRLGMLDPR